MTSSAKYKKAPDAPKRFKSAFIIFSAEKHKEIKERLQNQGRAEKTTDIAKLVSEAWREMSAEEKESWEKKARKDKARYEAEKSMYKGPWKIPANKRTPKDPTAPKRPMSAFLAFSNKRRAALKREHPEATNADLSKMLSKSWKEAPEEVRAKYMDEESALRTHYKTEMGKWRKKVAEGKKVERQEREAMAMEAAETEPPNESSVAPLPVAPVEPRQYSRNSSGESVSGPPSGGHQHQHQPPPNQPPPDMSGGMGPGGPPGPGMYGNPYGMGGPPMDGYGGYGPMPPGPPPHGYPNLMGGYQPMMGGPSPQHQFISQLFNQGFKPGSAPGQRGGMGMYGQGGPPPGMPVQPGYGYGGMGEMPPHQSRSMMDPSGHPHPHMGGSMGPGGYGPGMGGPPMGHGGMHEMMGPHHGHGHSHSHGHHPGYGHSRDHSGMGHHMSKKEDHHYGN